MKKIENKQTEIPEGKDKYASYFDLIKFVINKTEKGFTVNDIRSRLKITDAIEENDKEIAIDDAEYNVIVTAFDDFKWGIAHKDLVEFADYIKGIK